MRALSKIDYGKSGSMHFVQIEVAWEKKSVLRAKTAHWLRVLQKTPEGEIGISIGCDAL